MKTEEILILVLGIGLVISPFLEELNSRLTQDTHSLLSYISSVKFTWEFYVSLAIITLPLLFYLNYKLNSLISKSLETRRVRKEEVRNSIQETKRLLAIKLDNLDYPEMHDFISNLGDSIEYLKRDKHLKEFYALLTEKLRKANYLLVELEHRDELGQLHDQKYSLQGEIGELEKEIHQKKRELEREQKVILNDLEIHSNPVFKKESLTEEEIKVLFDNGYGQVNEYCVFEKKLITTLVKSISNHSKTHTFLVWSVKKLLDRYSDIKNIKENLSVGADIIFDYKGDKYAIEIETGSLLGKKKQTDEKIKYLNRKYPNKWLIVVSNKNLLSKYNKFGFVTQRNAVAEDLEKMLNSTTQS